MGVVKEVVVAAAAAGVERETMGAVGMGPIDGRGGRMQVEGRSR